MPDNEADYGDHEVSSQEDDEDALDALGTEALVWQLLLLINPGDEETALRQFSHYRDALEQADPDTQPVWLLKDAIDWRSGFHVDWKDSATFVDAITELVARWNLAIDWDGDASDDEFLERHDVATLMAIAYDRLREYGYTLWTWNTEGEGQAGWMTLSRDDEAMRLLATALEIELRPGSDPF
jgi:hypothetical protein